MKPVFLRALLPFFILTRICGFAAEPEFHTGPAVQLTFPTETGKLYQPEVQVGDEWKNDGPSIPGTGETMRLLRPAGKYRITNPSKEWVLVWADEFDGDKIDFTKWEREENNYGGGNNERQAYRTDSKYSFVKDGNLNIAVYRDAHTTNDGKTQPYSSARLRTLNRGDWKFGRFEIRAKMPKGEGIWPAVWMLPTASKYGGWAAGGEIDIIESRGSAVHETTGALHFGGAWPRNVYLAHAYQFPGKDAAEDFHVYALEWNADEISWFVDGKKWKTRKKDEWFSETAKDNASAPYDQPFHLILNVAVDGRFFEKTDQKADRIPADLFPQTLLVDYVRVFQWAE
ncbi:MAG: glycoside hydrolase family 16 protein [Verrucomicrobiales bacterium]|nr:glycoside hydrolase family 16 protein [Verrucomicrobiales bacterium]